MELIGRFFIWAIKKGFLEGVTFELHLERGAEFKKEKIESI